jgi:integrase
VGCASSNGFAWARNQSIFGPRWQSAADGWTVRFVSELCQPRELLPTMRAWVLSAGFNPGRQRYDLFVSWKLWANTVMVADLGASSPKMPASHSRTSTKSSAAIAAGHDIKTVADRLGHTNAAMTLRVYAHAFAASDRAVADSVGAMLEDGSE